MRKAAQQGDAPDGRLRRPQVIARPLDACGLIAY
jgi:hypothetical protein